MTATDDDSRLIVEVGQEARIANIVNPVVTGLGYRLVRVRLSGLNGATLQIMVERPDGTLTVSDCEIVSRDISPALDVNDPISGAYHLEISSPGIDRPLVRRSDFARWVGHEAKFILDRPLDGRRKFRGRLGEISGDSIAIAWEAYGDKSGGAVTLPLSDIAEARLVLTDELIEAVQPEADSGAADGANDNDDNSLQA